MMKIGGLWVSPIEIENRLMDHEAVHEAAVVSVMVDDVSRIKAAVILSQGHTPSEDLVGELQEWCKDALLRYQYPHVLEFVDDMDQTARELRRVLAPGGSLFVITPGRSPVVDLGLKLLTGKSAKEDFGNRRERVIPALERHFTVTRRIDFPIAAPALKLYTGLRLSPP